ncbi:DUF1540 domain-containing protein [Clostridium chauvoei]|uniref:DUF1540 domain-containing protein n=2 Tax=Clostridium chauvoei TaxID=46867 RepID=S6EN71_9CLOT|nr:DUF1540 domain-containing protein [Clostridium chauvoei]ATD56050.1 hypothetical protein BTM20_12905 [Clostridium chauvoei]ATD58197.1 hypothetical protein BTM21_10805 [Clostridium chauvoei]MBX7281621.1 DUF1540 domain-containing protein [Clostridium chauvoei]MBX7284158.1 DUF1540 domain-containing protein [Clostridium chauvoei]MBX7286686.1 DUF1540 domain-containing protein [Clostridium chauvoei]
MPKLNCCANNCTHNSENYCCRNQIDVGGENATHSGGTCCESFQESDGSFTNSIQSPNTNLSIACNATNCIHNSNCQCDAESVSVSGVSACTSEQTECSSFYAR